MSPQRHEIDWAAFGLSLAVVVATVLGLVAFPESGKAAVEAAFAFLTKRLGGLYLAMGLATLLLLLWLSVSSHGHLRLGGGDQPLEHSTWSWAGMLFSTGIGTAVLYMGTIEWIEYYRTPPFGLPALSDEAVPWAMSYGLFHWGIVGWGFYALPAVCVAYAYHVERRPSPSLAQACAPVFKDGVDRWPGTAINTAFMVGLLGAASTGLGLTTPLITEAFRAMVGMESSFALTLGAVVLIVVLIAISVSLGLDHGIKRLSNLNLLLMFALLGYVFFAGSPGPVLRQGVESIGFMLSHFPEMSGLSKTGTNKEFIAGWTVFYWAWWLAFGPFVGMFICKISRGRTLRQVIWGVLGFGTLGSTLCFVIMGGYSFHLHQQTELDLVTGFAEGKHATVVQVLISLPLGKWILPLFLSLCITFAATTYDSASYTLAASATRRLSPDADPARWHRVLWAFVLGILPLTLLSLNRESETLRVLQTASIVVSLPMILVTGLMVGSLLRSLYRRK